MAIWFPCCVSLHSILPMKQGIMFGQYLGAFNLMDTFKGRSKKQEWVKSDENKKWRMTDTWEDMVIFNPSTRNLILIIQIRAELLTNFNGSCLNTNIERPLVSLYLTLYNPCFKH